MMRRLGAAVAAALVLAAVAPPAFAQSEPQMVQHGLFAKVAVYAPTGPVQQFVLLLSGEDGPNETDRVRARTFAARGAMVALVDTPAFAARLDAEGGTCGFPSGAFENLSRHLQAFYKLPGYRRPLLIGRDAGGALAYGMLAQAEPGVFGGALSVGFCPRLPFRQPMCGGKALPPSQPASVPSVFDAASAAQRSIPSGSRLAAAARVPAPWLVLQPADASVCTVADPQGFVARVREAQWRALPAGTAPLTAALEAGYQHLAAQNRPPPPLPASLADLPIIEVPVSTPGNRFAVLVSGDGGWASIDKALAAALAAQGVPVAGFDSLRYFWSARTPEGFANDLDRLVRFYAARWARSELVLIGFSQGADVLPFAINRLDTEARGRLKLAALLSLGQKASFEFKVKNWLGPSGDVPVQPEAEKLAAAETLCVHGRADKASLCPALAPDHARVVMLEGGHHFDGDYEKLARLILSSVGP